MRKTLRKWFWVWEFEKEEKWLDEMSAQGWALDRVGYCRYEFVQCEPNEYITRLEMLEEHVDTPKSLEYIDFVESTGAEYLGHVIKWVYFRKKASEGSFDLYSDVDSRIRHLKRIIAFLSIFLCINSLNTLNMIHLAANSGEWFSYIALAFVCAVTVMLIYGVSRLNAMKKRLEAEHLLHE